MAVALSSPAHADMFRCGAKIVSESDSASEIQAKCGAPSSRRQRTEDIRAPNPNGGTRKVGTTTTEEWIYDRGSSAAPFVVTLIDGKVRSVGRLSASREPD